MESKAKATQCQSAIAVHRRKSILPGAGCVSLLRSRSSFDVMRPLVEANHQHETIANPTRSPRPCSGQGVCASSSQQLDLLALIQWLLVVLAAFSFAFTPLRASQDEWWHLKAGKWIVEQGRLPYYDIFTYTGEKLRWHNHEWLAQVLFYKIYAWGEERVVGGLRALITFKALVVALTFGLVALLAWRRAGSAHLAFLVALVAADVARRTIYPRPPILSYLLLALFLLLLYEWRAGRLRRRWLLLLPPLTILWANLHGMVPLAVAATGAFAAGEFLELSARAYVAHRRHVPRGALRRFLRPHHRRLRFLAGLTFAVLVAACLNPSGPHVFFLGRKFTADPILQRVIAEMLPTPFLFSKVSVGAREQWMFVPLYVSFWLSLLALAVVFVARRGRLRCGADYVLGAFFTWQAVAHVRLLPLYAVAVMPILATLLADATQRWRVQRPFAMRIGPAMLTVGIFLWYVFGVAEPPPQTFFRRNLALLAGKDKEPADYPDALYKYILRVGFPDRMFSEINYCGYAIWWLSPETHKLFTDNRFDLFGSRYYIEEATVVNALESSQTVAGRGWREILDAYGVNFIVISRSAPLNRALKQSGAWDHVYYHIPPLASPSSGFNIWLRRDPRWAPIAQRAREIFRQEMPGLPAPEELDALLERNKDVNSARREIQTP